MKESTQQLYRKKLKTKCNTTGLLAPLLLPEQRLRRDGSEYKGATYAFLTHHENITRRELGPLRGLRVCFVNVMFRSSCLWNCHENLDEHSQHSARGNAKDKPELVVFLPLCCEEVTDGGRRLRI